MHRLSATLAILGVAALALALSACQNTASACPQIVLPSQSMLYPIPGASNVPDNAPYLIIGQVLNGGATYTLTSPTASTITASTTVAVPSPLPTPIALGSPAAAVALPALAAHATYTVTSSNSGPVTACSSGQPGGNLGTFTTH